MTPQETLKLLETEKLISKLLGQDSNHLINFNYQEIEQGNTILNLETINPKYNQMFLYHSTVGINKNDALIKMLEYIKTQSSLENTYTFQWSDNSEKGVRISYFQARSIEQALEKFRYGRDRNKTTIFLIALNPQA